MCVNKSFILGEGQFGKVYSCVNLDTGEPMALKKIQFRSNDVVHVKSIADEINNMQGIQHENLVKIYGAELHRVSLFSFNSVFCSFKIIKTNENLERNINLHGVLW